MKNVNCGLLGFMVAATNCSVFRVEKSVQISTETSSQCTSTLHLCIHYVPNKKAVLLTIKRA